MLFEGFILLENKDMNGWRWRWMSWTYAAQNSACRDQKTALGRYAANAVSPYVSINPSMRGTTHEIWRFGEHKSNLIQSYYLFATVSGDFAAVFGEPTKCGFPRLYGARNELHEEFHSPSSFTEKVAQKTAPQRTGAQQTGPSRRIPARVVSRLPLRLHLGSGSCEDDSLCGCRKGMPSESQN